VSSYKSLIFSFILLFIAGCSSKHEIAIDKKVFEDEDKLIVHALEYERSGNFNNSKRIYEELYEYTKRYNYLLKAAKINLKTKDYVKAKELSKKNIKHFKHKEEELTRIYIASLIGLKEYDKALLTAKELLKKYNNSLNYETVANVYYMIKDYKNSIKYFESAYASNANAKTLLNLVNILYTYLNQKEKAISYLETHSRLYECNFEVCSRLLIIYQEQKNIDGMISVLKRSFNKFKKDKNIHGQYKMTNMLLPLLEQKDIKLAIKFLEKNKLNDLKLLSLYKRTNQLKKALNLMKDLYKKTKYIDLLAQIAILEFEVAKDKRKVLKSVIKKFEDVLAVLDNHTYQNFLGYLLIDYDIDVRKGLGLVKKALKKSPNNVAYIDSLAWGQYKLKECKDALRNMKIVVDEIGLDDNEIKLHWEKIKECNKKE